MSDWEIIEALDALYTEADLDRIAQALGMIPCDPSAALVREVFATLHAACERGWRGDPLVYPPHGRER
jgi:hypothetical protein